MMRYGMLLIVLLCGCSLQVLPMQTPTVRPVLPLPPTATTPPLPAAQGECLFTAFGIGGEVPIYTSPDAESAVVGQTEQAQPPLVVVSVGGSWTAGPNSGQWYEVVLPDGGTGWIIDNRGSVSGDCDF